MPTANKSELEFSDYLQRLWYRWNEDFYFEPYLWSTGGIDFLLIHRDIGVYVCEVKWLPLECISPAENGWLMLKYGNNPPYRWDMSSLKTTTNNIQNIISVSEYSWKKILPIWNIIAFPNIKRSEFKEKCDDYYISNKNSLIFSEDMLNKFNFFTENLTNIQQIWWYSLEKNKPTLEQWEKEKQKILKPYQSYEWTFTHTTTTKNDSIGNAALQQEIWFPNPTTEWSVSFSARIKILDEVQYELARSYSIPKGYRYIKWWPGTGKSILANYIAYSIHRQFPQYKILVLFHNAQLKDLYANLNQEVNIQIDTFSGYINRFFWVSGQCNTSEDWEWLGISTLEKMQEGEFEQYDFIIIDEAQDFYPSWGKVVWNLALWDDDSKKNVVCFFDLNQDCMWKTRVWAIKDIFQVDGRWKTEILKRCYRSEKSIIELSNKLLTNNDDKMRPLSEDDESMHYPVIELELKQQEKVNERIYTMIEYFIKQWYTLNEMCVIANSNWPLNQLKYFIDRQRVKYQIQKLTHKKAKWREFPIVFIIWFEEWNQNDFEQIKNDLYVSITRAQEYLYVYSVRPTKVLEILKEDESLVMTKDLFEELNHLSKLSTLR